jgi:hypothetical protein
MIRLSPSQAQVLQGLVASGGTVHYQLLTRAVYGLRRADVSADEHRALQRCVLQLQRQGLVTIARQWGTMGYGQPGLVDITADGRAWVDGAAPN